MYDMEAHDLFELKASRTMVRLFDTVRPVVDEIGAKSKDSSTLELVSWANWYHASALMVVGRQDEAIALMAENLPRLDPAWPDAAKLRNNYINVLTNGSASCSIARTTRARSPRLEVPRRVQIREHLRRKRRRRLSNWSLDHQRAGDWQSARKVLQDCVGELPNDSRCRDALADLESRHRF